MDIPPDALAALSMAMGAAWASGLNLYATALIIGGLGAMGVIPVPPDLEVLASPPVLITAAVLYAIEFLADKVPGLDTLNDTLHTFIRIPAGALLAYGSVAHVAEPWQAAAALVLGGVVTAGTHAAKTGARAVINTSPEPFSNWAASIAEDVMVVIGLFLALFQPVIFLIWFAVFVLFLLWFLPKLWRGVRTIWQKLRGTPSLDAEMSSGSGIITRFKGPPPAAGGAQADRPPPIIRE